jgi:FkbM family methyltransferase
MLVNTRLLFLDLLRDLRIDSVCDVGSMDGSDALAFRERLPRARIIAWEPNPANLTRMQADPRLSAARVEIVGAAASDSDGYAPFFVVPADHEIPNPRRGMSSLYRRADPAHAVTEISVPTLRLDGVIEAHAETAERIALWIDTEGKAFEVLEGARGVASRVHLIHVEVESQACINTQQRLYADARGLMEQLGFEELATDYPRDNPQFNAIYVRRGRSLSELRRIGAHVRAARLRRQVVDALWTHCPAVASRLAALRRRWLDR